MKYGRKSISLIAARRDFESTSFPAAAIKTLQFTKSVNEVKRELIARCEYQLESTPSSSKGTE